MPDAVRGRISPVAVTVANFPLWLCCVRVRAVCGEALPRCALALRPLALAGAVSLARPTIGKRQDFMRDILNEVLTWTFSSTRSTASDSHPTSSPTARRIVRAR